MRCGLRPVHRYQQHTDHGDRDEGRTGGTWSRLGGIDAEESELDEISDHAESVTVGSDT